MKEKKIYIILIRKYIHTFSCKEKKVKKKINAKMQKRKKKKMLENVMKVFGTKGKKMKFNQVRTEIRAF